MDEAIMRCRSALQDNLSQLERDLRICIRRSAQSEHVVATPRHVSSNGGMSLLQYQEKLAQSEGSKQYHALAEGRDVVLQDSLLTPEAHGNGLTSYTPRTPLTPRTAGVGCQKRPPFLQTDQPTPRDVPLAPHIQRKWETLVSSLQSIVMVTSTASMDSTHGPRASLPLRDCWIVQATDEVEFGQSAHSMQLGSLRGHGHLSPWSICLRSTQEFDMQQQLRAGDTLISKTSYLQKLIRHPDGSINLFYLMLSSMLIFYDIITFPILIAFDWDTGDFGACVTWVGVIFWTLDIGMSCCVGYHTRSVIEMRPLMIVQHYARTWFVFDFTIVSLDWFILIINLYSDVKESSSTPGMFRLFKSVRATRMLRCFRVLRIFKASKQVRTFLSGIASDLTMVIAKIVLLIIVILLVNHYLACVWFGLAYWNTLYASTWIKAFASEDESHFTLYCLSYHWSVTQFTPATNDIAPRNRVERIFAIFIGLFALCMFSNFISSLTNGWAEIKRINDARASEEREIRDFLRSRNVSISLANHIWYFHRHYHRHQSLVRREFEIPFFQRLPMSTRAALYKEIYVPTLKSYVVFYNLGKFDWSIHLSICTDILVETFHTHGQELFSPGEAQSMFILTSGVCTYNCDMYWEELELRGVAIVSEAVLWCLWGHLGVMRVESRAMALKIEAGNFINVIRKRLLSDEFLFRACQVYAALFSQYVVDSHEGPSPITDIVHPESEFQRLDMNDLATRAFRQTDSERKILRNAAKSGSSSEDRRISGGSSDRPSMESRPSVASAFSRKFANLGSYLLKEKKNSTSKGSTSFSIGDRSGSRLSRGSRVSRASRVSR